MAKTEWQWHYLTNDYVENATNAATLRIKLPVREQISCIEIEMYATVNNADYDHSIIDAIEKIEVIGDGASVLYSCIPETAAFLHFTQIRSMPNILRMDYDGTVDHYRVKICFGRYQRDPEYMLDTSVYLNVYLEIPWTLSTYYFDTHTFTHTIRYLRPIQKLSPKGFIRSRDIEYGFRDWSGGAGTWAVDLPLKYPWYMVGCRIYDIDQDLVSDISHIKLDIDDGRLILVDDDTDDLITINTERLPYPVHVYQKKGCSCGADSYVRSYLGRCEEANITPYIDNAFNVGANIISLTGQRIKFDTQCAGGAISVPFNASFWGTCPFCCLIIKDWFKDWFEPEPHDPFPVGEHSQAEILYTHGAYDMYLRTFLQEVCPLKI